MNSSWGGSLVWSIRKIKLATLDPYCVYLNSRAIVLIIKRR